MHHPALIPEEQLLELVVLQVYLLQKKVDREKKNFPLTSCLYVQIQERPIIQLPGIQRNILEGRASLVDAFLSTYERTTLR